MSEETIILFVVPVIAFAGTVLVAHWLGKLRQGIALVGLVLLWAGFTGAMFFGMEQASGWDGLGYMLALAVLCAPCGVGLGLGSLIGWIRGGRQQQLQ